MKQNIKTLLDEKQLEAEREKMNEEKAREEEVKSEDEHLEDELHHLESESDQLQNELDEANKEDKEKTHLIQEFDVEIDRIKKQLEHATEHFHSRSKLLRRLRAALGQRNGPQFVDAEVVDPCGSSTPPSTCGQSNPMPYNAPPAPASGCNGQLGPGCIQWVQSPN